MMGTRERACRKLEVELDDRVKLRRERNLWSVQAISENFVALVQQAPFQPKGIYRYTVVDWRSGIRGPCDLIGQSWGDGSYSRTDCAEMLDALEYDYREDPEVQAILAAGGTSWPSKISLEVSHRNWLRIDIEAINGEPVELQWVTNDDR